MQEEIIANPVGDVEAKALVDTLAEILPKTKAETLRDTLGDDETLALVDALSHTPLIIHLVM